MWLALTYAFALALALPSLAEATSPPAPAPVRSEGDIFLASQPPEMVTQLMREGVVLVNKRATSNKRHDGQATHEELINALVLFDQDIDTVLQLLSATDRQDEYLPVLHKATTLAHSPDGDLDQHELKVLLVTIVYRVQHQWNVAEHTMQWHLDPTFKNDLRDVRGTWKLYRLDDHHTIGKYASRVDVGRAVPRFIQDFLTKRDLPKALQSQRKWVNSLGTFRKS